MAMDHWKAETPIRGVYFMYMAMLQVGEILRDPVSRSLPLPGLLSSSLWAGEGSSIREEPCFDHAWGQGWRGRGGLGSGRRVPENAE